MHETQKHEMRLQTTHPSGAEEWYCPTCGRRFLMQWPPKYKRIILEPGDEHAAHSCSKGGLHIGSLQITQAEEIELTPRLRSWLTWLENVNLDV